MFIWCNVVVPLYCIGEFMKLSKHCLLIASFALFAPAFYACDDGNCKSDPECVCGDGSIDEGEECDGTNFGAKTCSDYVGEGATGNLVCNAQCKIETTACVAKPSACGNGKLDDGEECDGTNFGAKTCVDYAGIGATGNLVCNDQCKIETSNCTAKGSTGSSCGNGVLDAGEVCDGDLMNGQNCASLGAGYTGILKCKDDCSAYDDSDCKAPDNKLCGNGVLDEGELCDGDQIRGGVSYTCKSIFGPGSEGELKCDSTCLHFDKSGCTPALTCGNGTLQINEKCDPKYDYGDKLACSASFSQGTEGTRVCDSMCRWDNSNCVAPSHCGNGTLDADLGEECDPSAPQSYYKTCEDAFGTGSKGMVVCTELCKYSYAFCTNTDVCGNGQVDNGTNNTKNYNEVCDPGDLKGKSCASLGSGYTGTLKCLVNCSGFDFSECEAPAE